MCHLSRSSKSPFLIPETNSLSVVPIIMAVPMIVSDVRPFIYVAVLISVHITCTAASSCWRWRRNATAVPAMLCAAALGNRADRQQ